MAFQIVDEQGQPRRHGKQLHLICTKRESRNRCKSSLASGSGSPIDCRLAARLARALMFRLKIPEDSTMVGLLGVGPSKSNYDELSRWITKEHLPLPETKWTDIVDTLARRFQRVVDELRDA